MTVRFQKLRRALSYLKQNNAVLFTRYGGVETCLCNIHSDAFFNCRYSRGKSFYFLPIWANHFNQILFFYTCTLTKKKFSNTSACWITRNKHLLEWSQHRKYCMYTLQNWHSEYSIYAKYKTNENRKTWSPNLLCNPLCNVGILTKNRFRSLNYTPKSISNTLRTRNIGIWMFVLIKKY